MYDRDSQTLRRDEEQLRQSAVAKAERWTESQAEVRNFAALGRNRITFHHPD